MNPIVFSPSNLPAEAVLPKTEKSPSEKLILFHCLAVVFGATSIVVGVLWDISWHLTIGRDTFWTPAHMAIYLGGVLGGCSSGWLALKTTFWGTAEERAGSVNLWGFKAPLGAWVSIWGAFAMLTSAPFDDWWHNAYGLDVQILSPPHSVLAAGIYALAIGALLVVVSVQNRGSSLEKIGGNLFAYTGGMMLSMAAIWVTEYSYPNHQHTASFYKVSAFVYPSILVMVARASRIRYAATKAALAYMVIRCLMIWILPLFEATPLLAPVRNPLDHMVPPPFPLLLIAPAFLMDWCLQRWNSGVSWKKDLGLVLILSVLFMGVFIPLHWYFSAFQLTPAADNWFFAGNRYWGYSDTVDEWTTRFWKTDRDPFTLVEAGKSLAIAVLSCAIGFLSGTALRKVRR